MGGRIAFASLRPIAGAKDRIQVMANDKRYTINEYLQMVFYVFLSSCLNPEWIGDVAVGFYLDACIQGKSYGHSSKDNVSNRRKGFSWFSF